MCKWVVDNYSDKVGENQTIRMWVEASQAVLDADTQTEFVEA